MYFSIDRCSRSVSGVYLRVERESKQFLSDAVRKQVEITAGQVCPPDRTGK